MLMVRLSVAALLAFALLPPAVLAAEPYEGAWVTTLKDCGDEDGFTSLTVIDLRADVDGKPTPMLEQYEHHCRIDKKTTVGSNTTLTATCYEFWDDFKKDVGSQKETIKLSVASKDLLKINGKQYRRCLAFSKAGKGARKR